MVDFFVVADNPKGLCSHLVVAGMVPIASLKGDLGERCHDEGDENGAANEQGSHHVGRCRVSRGLSRRR